MEAADKAMSFINALLPLPMNQIKPTLASQKENSKQDTMNKFIHSSIETMNQIQNYQNMSGK